MKYLICLVLLTQIGCAEWQIKPQPMDSCKSLCQARKVKFYRDDSQNCTCNTDFEEQKDIQESKEEE